MINLKKTIVCLFGSCLLCSALTLSWEKGRLSTNLYDCLTTYKSGCAGISDVGRTHSEPQYTNEACKGFLSAEGCSATTTAKSYSDIASHPVRNTLIAWNTDFSPSDDGWYWKKANRYCPLLCSTEGIPNSAYKGAITFATGEKGTVFIRGLEMIGPLGVGAPQPDQPLSEISFMSCPVAIDTLAFDQVTDLRKVSFDGFPYYVVTDAFPPTVTEIEFHDKLVNILLEKKTADGFENALKQLALSNKPENAAQAEAIKTSLYSQVEQWTRSSDNEPHTLFNYLKNHREYEWTRDAHGDVFLHPKSHLYLVNLASNDPYLLWTTKEKFDESSDLYWGEYYNMWGDIQKVEEKTTNEKGPLLHANDQTTESTEKKSSAASKNEALATKVNTSTGSSDAQREASKLATKESNSNGASNVTSAKTTTSLSSDATPEGNSNTELTNTTSSASSSNSTKQSASTKTGSESISLIPAILSGGSALILKKKKDD